MNTYILYLKFESLVAPGKVGGEREHNRSRRGHVLEGGEVIPPFTAKDAISPVVGDLEAVEGARAAALSLPSDTALQFEGEKMEAQEAIASAGKNIRQSSGRLLERTDTRKWHRVSINRQKVRARGRPSFLFETDLAASCKPIDMLHPRWSGYTKLPSTTGLAISTTSPRPTVYSSEQPLFSSSTLVAEGARKHVVGSIRTSIVGWRVGNLSQRRQGAHKVRIL